MRFPVGNRRQWLGASAAVVGGVASAAGAQPPESLAPIRIGQIGVAHAHASKLQVYRDSPHYEVVGVVEPDPDLCRWAQGEEVYRDLTWMTQEQLLNQPGLQAVLVETAVRDSLSVAEACITAGLHIHLDKPAGESLPHLERILKAAERQGLMVQLGYMYRYNPAIVQLRQLLERGWLGELFEVHTVMSKVVPPQQRQQLAEYPGGMMFELGCHILDLVVGLLGEPLEVTPFARRVGPHQDSLEDNMLAVLEYPSALATIKSTAVEVAGGERRHLVACGTEGTFHIQPLDDPTARLALARPRGPFRAGYQQLTFGDYRRYVGDAEDMAQVIRQQKPDSYGYTHELAVQRTLLRACGLPLTEA